MNRTIRTLLAAATFLVASVSFSSAETVILRTGQVGGVPGFPSVGGFDDSFRMLPSTACAAQLMPTAAVAILVAPLAITTANDLGMSPYALVMTVALAASASFMSPVAHPANVLMMGPGGYRFIDYIKVGLPLTLACLVVTLLLLPLIWPLAA